MRSLTSYIAHMQVNTARDIGALIKDRRRTLNVSQSDLAARVGVSRLWIVNLEKGKSTAQISLVLRTLKELGVSIDASFIKQGIDAKRQQTDAVDLNAIIQKTKAARP